MRLVLALPEIDDLRLCIEPEDSIEFVLGLVPEQVVLNRSLYQQCCDLGIVANATLFKAVDSVGDLLAWTPEMVEAELRQSTDDLNELLSFPIGAMLAPASAMLTAAGTSARSLEASIDLPWIWLEPQDELIAPFDIRATSTAWLDCRRSWSSEVLHDLLILSGADIRPRGFDNLR